MLRSAKELDDQLILATDGDVGQVEDLYFDDEGWTIRYLVVNTGDWLSGRSVLISPISVADVDWEHQRINLSLAREQVEKSPDIDTARPISRQNEESLYRYYGWPHYWGGPGVWGPGLYPGALSTAAVLAQAPADVTRLEPREPEQEPGGQERQDTHLRSTREVTGYRIQARDGEVGHISDFLIDDQTWRINYIVVDTSNWWFGKKVILAPTWIKQVSWPEQQAVVDLKRETVKNSPEFNPDLLKTRA